LIGDIKIAVVIPCFKVKNHIINVIREIPSYVDMICVVDDFCPENTGAFVEGIIKSKKLKVLFSKKNLGVGGAVISGYQHAMHNQMDIIVKIDGDGQMDPRLINNFIAPILNGEADYCKGNRFYDLEEINQMPSMRILGNSFLSLFNKFSSGYWDIFDPTNGYTAIHSSLIRKIPFEKVSSRFFFESDMLFRLSILRAVVFDIPMDAKYHGEKSNLKISKIFMEFLYKHIRNTFKRIFYNYYLRGMTAASFELPLGIILASFGFFYGLINWANGISVGSANSAGTVILSALPLIVGIQFILAFLSYDVYSIPRKPIHTILNSISRNNKFF
jgi:glycosyltransferase involved in cell wall biosynthesis